MVGASAPKKDGSGTVMGTDERYAGTVKMAVALGNAERCKAIILAP